MDTPVIGLITQEGMSLHAEIISKTIVGYLRKASVQTRISDCKVVAPHGLILLAPGELGLAGFAGLTSANPGSYPVWTHCAICGEPWYEMYLHEGFCSDCCAATTEMVQSIRDFWMLRAELIASERDGNGHT